MRRQQLTPFHRLLRVYPVLAVLSSAFLLASGCQSARTKSETAGQPAYPSMHQSVSNVVPKIPDLQMYLPHPSDDEKSNGSLIAKPITANGENSAAAFSPDGSRLLFLSANRPGHRHAQVYELLLGSMIERRITFHDGDDTGPSYYPNGEHILYSSSTDELKEEPAIIENAMRTYLGGKTPAPENADSRKSLGVSELYRQTLDGREISRLTDSNGFDGDASLDAKGSRIIFTSNRFGHPNLYFMDTRGLHRLTDGTESDRNAKFSPDNKAIAWSRYSKDLTSARILLAEGAVQKAQPITSQGFLDLYPVWHPKGDDIVFSSNRGGKGFDLYVIDRKGQCLRRLTDVDGDEVRPALSPDGTKIVFSGNQSGSNQIYLMDYRPSPICLPGAARD